MYNWRIKDLVAETASIIDQDVSKLQLKLKGAKDKSLNTFVQQQIESLEKSKPGIQDRVSRVANKLTFEVQNSGISSANRAINVTATNLFNITQIISMEMSRGYELDGIRVEKSDICRPDSDCQDVLFTFFNPDDRLGKAKHVYRTMVDVSKVIPVFIGSFRDWFEY